MGYEGHTVFIKDVAERRQKTEASVKQLTDTAELLRRDGIPVDIVSSGGTGTYFITGRYPGVTEIQVGSYITMDSQYREEVGIDFDYGLTVLSSVISVPEPQRAEVDAGLKAVTRDFGLPIVIDPPGWQLTGLAEEHGHLKRLDGPPLKPGDKVKIVPNHGCTTINLHDQYHVVRGDVLEAVWPIAGRGKTY
jgi:D-serine deaminase-like pyridoxal phosphate-dependent protein